MADISLKFGVQGDQNMKTALAAINSQIKGLDAEMKLAVSQMSNMDNAEERNARTSEILERQYSANAEKVKLLGDRYKDSESKLSELAAKLEEAKDTYGENSAEVQKLQNEYNKQAKATSDLRTEMTKAQTKMQDAKNAANALGKETGEAAVELEKGAKATSTFGDMLKAKLTGDAIIGAIKKLGQGLKDLTVGVVQFSDDLATQASVTGLTTDALQEYNYMAELVDVSVDTITGSMTKLTKSMNSAKSGSGTAADAFKSLGIVVTNSNGELRSNQEIFEEVIDALGNISNETERDAKAMELFGKSAKELNPLIKAGSKQIKAYAQEAHEMGYVMSSDMIDKNLEASDAMERMKNSITAVKNYIGSQFAPVIKTVAETIQRLIQYAREHEDAMKRIAAALTAVVAGFVAYKAATAAAAAATALLANPVGLAVAALAALVVAAAAMGDGSVKASEEVIALGNDIEATGQKIDAQVASWQAIEAARDSAISQGSAEIEYNKKLLEELDSIVDANGNINKGYESRAEFITGQLSDAFGVEIKNQDGVIKNYNTMKAKIQELMKVKQAEIILNAQETAYSEAIKKMGEVTLDRAKAEDDLRKAMQARDDNAAAIAALEAEREKEVRNRQFNVYTQRMREIDDEIAERKAGDASLAESVSKAVKNYNAAEEALKGYTYNIRQYETNMQKFHEGKLDEINTVTYETAKSYDTLGESAKKAMDDMYGSAIDVAKEMLPKGENIGKQLLSGVKQGVTNAKIRAEIDSELNRLSSQMVKAVKRPLAIQSPSKVMEQIGGYFLEGFSVGLKNEEGEVLSQVSRASSDILGAFSESPASMTAINGSPALQTSKGTYVIQLTLDGRQIATNTTNIQLQRQKAYAL